MGPMGMQERERTCIWCWYLPLAGISGAGEANRDSIGRIDINDGSWWLLRAACVSDGTLHFPLASLLFQSQEISPFDPAIGQIRIASRGFVEWRQVFLTVGSWSRLHRQASFTRCGPIIEVLWSNFLGDVQRLVHGASTHRILSCYERG